MVLKKHLRLSVRRMIVERIYEWAKRQPHKTAVIWNDVSLSYLAFSNCIRTACDFFQRENLPVGGTAVVLVHDLLDTWIIVMALRALGLNTVSVRSVEQAQSLRIRDIACIIATPAEAAAKNLAVNTITDAKIVAIPPSMHSIRNTNELADVYHNVHPFGGHILYTSGTTGTYKKAMMRGEHEEGRDRARAQFASLDNNTIFHGIDFELWNSIGFKNPSAIWYVGGCIIFDQRKDNFKNFFSHKVDFAMVMPWQLKILLREQEPFSRPNGFAIAATSGALSIDLAEQCIQKLTERLSLEYGSTEINSVRLQSWFKTNDDLNWLMPTDGKLIQIVDENGRECPNGQEGELRILLSDIDCHHYYDDEEASTRVFHGGFFYPGDLAVRREDGRIGILGRTADVIVVKGEKLATAPIEEAIQHNLQVDEVCLFSGLSEQGHEELIIAIQSDRRIPKSQLEAIARKFPRFERVRFSIRNEFPRTETGTRKTKRAQLKKLVFEEFSGHKR